MTYNRKIVSVGIANCRLLNARHKNTHLIFLNPAKHRSTAMTVTEFSWFPYVIASADYCTYYYIKINGVDNKKQTKNCNRNYNVIKKAIYT